MWRLLFGLWLLVGVLPGPSAAQQWTGTAALGITGGHQTNAYLDPVLHSWTRSSDPAFAALTPRLGLVRDAPRTRLGLTVRTRLYPRRPNAPQFVQGSARWQYRLSSAWTVGATGGGTRDRFISSRDSWWVLPSVQWAPTSGATLALRGGLTRRHMSPGQAASDRQTSGLVALTADMWWADRLRAEGRLYWSSGHSSASDAQFGGTGLSGRGTYWPTPQWSLETEVALEQVRYGTASTSTVRDRIGRVGLKVQWRAHSSVTLFGRARTSVARLDRAGRVETDVHVSAGLRLRAQRVLGGPAAPAPRRRVCWTVDDGIRVQIPFGGSGTPHLTGDFNGWSLPGIPLTESGDDTWTTTLAVPSGEYAYRVRVVDGSEGRWLDLPSYAQTAEDAFGGTNGVCTAK